MNSLRDAKLQQLKNLTHNYTMITQDFIDFYHKNKEFVYNTDKLTEQITTMIRVRNTLKSLVITEIFPTQEEKQK